MPRYFVAIPLPDETRERLIAVQPPALPGMRLLAGDELHLTLHFLGEVDLDAARSALAKIKMNAFTINIGGVGVFSSERQAKVLWAGVEANADLTELHRAVGAALTNGIGFRPEDRPYSPHITLARLNEPLAPEVINGYLEANHGFEDRSAPIDRFALYLSRFVDNVPKYHEEAAFALMIYVRRA